MIPSLPGDAQIVDGQGRFVIPGLWDMHAHMEMTGESSLQLYVANGDVFFAIADEARRQKLPVAGHVPLKVTIQEGVDAGMVSIEHLSEDGRVWKACSGGSQYRPDACRPFFEMLARRHVWQTPTLLAMAELAVIGTPASAISHVVRPGLPVANEVTDES